MVYSVTGELIHIEANLAVVSCSGVGFACRTTDTSLEGLKVGDVVTFKTHMGVREDAIELFGFTTKHELDCFKMLLSISGVGNKAALSILSELSPQAFALAVVADDAKALTRIKGIGAKTAQLIILKLKDKLGGNTELAALSTTSTGGAKSGAALKGGAAAVSALMVLGFTASEAAAALMDLPSDMDTAEKIKQALKKLSSR